MKTFLIDEKAQIESIIKACQVCFVGMSDEEGMPYVLPMNFGYREGVLYLHSAQEGRSIRILEKNPNICITFCPEPTLISQHPEVACSYRMKGGSVICEGKVHFEEDFDKKTEALNIIMRHYTDKSFTYSDPAVKNVKVWIFPMDKVKAKEFGVMKPGIISYKDRAE